MTIVLPSAESVPLNPTDCGIRWQQIIKDAVRDPVELCQLLGLPDSIDAARRSAAIFPVFVPRGFLAKMRRFDLHDPLLRQVLPLEDERISRPGFSRDAVGDQAATLRPGLLQKYHGRVLIVTTGTCAVHCRYCFRRHFPYSESPPSPAVWDQAFAQIAADSSIEEVILSGGDPLTIRDDRLTSIAHALSQIEHVQRLRVHTRLPVMIPERVTDSLLDWLTGTRLTTVVVIHANHPQEIDADVLVAIRRMIDRGVPVLNQSVLLRGVNDSAEVLATLCRRLANVGVLPYYLHQLDKVEGASHFEVPIRRGLELVEHLRQVLPGYAVPRYVHEVPGAASKQVLA